MNRDTSFKPIKVNEDKDPGSAGVYGIVRTGACLDGLIDGSFKVLIQRRDGEWVLDMGFLGLVVEKGRLVMEAYEKVDGKLWLYKSFAVPKPLLVGHEDYVQEWVREEELPRFVRVESGVRVIRRVLPDGTIEEEYIDEDEEKRKNGGNPH